MRRELRGLHHLPVGFANPVALHAPAVELSQASQSVRDSLPMACIIVMPKPRRSVSVQALSNDSRMVLFDSHPTSCF